MSNKQVYTYFDTEKELTSGKIRKVYLISAFDDFLADIFIKKIAALRFYKANENIFYRYADDVSFNDVAELCFNYTSFFAQEKLVIVKRCEKFSKELERIKDYIAKPDPDTILLLIFDKNFINEKKLYKDFEVADFSAYSQDELSVLLRNEFETRGMKIDNASLDLFISILPENLSIALNEIEKIYSFLIYNPDKVVNSEVILKLAGYEPELTPFELIKAILIKDRCKALTISDHLIDKSGFNEINLLYSLFNYYTDLLCFKSKNFDKYNRNVAYTKYRIWGADRWEIGKSFANQIEVSEIEFAVDRIMQSDRRLKSSMLDSKVILTSLIEELSNFNSKRN